MLYPFILLCLLGFTWGTGFSIAKFAMQNGVTPLGYSFWQSLGPAIFISLIVWVKEKKFISFSKEHLWFYAACGLLGICLPNLTMYFSVSHLNSGLLGVVVNTSPIITYVFSILLLIEKFKVARFLGVLLGFVGLLLLVGQNLQFAAKLQWLSFALITPLLLAMCTIVMVKFRPPFSSSLSLSAGMLLASSLILAPLTFYAHQFHPLVSLNLPNIFIVIEIILSSVGYILFFELLRVAGPVYYSSVGCVVALVGLFWGNVIFKEGHSHVEWIAIVCILCAIFLVSFVKAERS